MATTIRLGENWYIITVPCNFRPPTLQRTGHILVRPYGQKLSITRRSGTRDYASAQLGLEMAATVPLKCSSEAPVRYLGDREKHDQQSKPVRKCRVEYIHAFCSMIPTYVLRLQGIRCSVVRLARSESISSVLLGTRRASAAVAHSGYGV